MDWRTTLITLALAFHADGFSKYGRTCKDIGCLNSEVCVLAEDPCSYGHTRDCGTFPTCKKKSKVEGSHAEPPAPKPIPAKPQSHDFDSPPSYNPPAPPPGGNSPYGGGSPYGGTSNGGASYGGGSPYGGNSNGGASYGGGSPYGGGSNGGSSNGGGSPYGGNSNGGGSPYGGNSPYGGSSNGGGSPYGGSPYGNGGHASSGGNSPYGGNSGYGGGSSTGGTGGSGKSPLDSILNTLNKYAGGSAQGGSGGSGLSNIFGNVLGNLSKNGIGNLFGNTRPIQENPNYSSYGSDSRSSNTQNYPSGGYQQNQAPNRNKNYGQTQAVRNGATSKPYQAYGWNVR